MNKLFLKKIFDFLQLNYNNNKAWEETVIAAPRSTYTKTSVIWLLTPIFQTFF